MDEPASIKISEVIEGPHGTGIIEIEPTPELVNALLNERVNVMLKEMIYRERCARRAINENRSIYRESSTIYHGMVPVTQIDEHTPGAEIHFARITVHGDIELAKKICTILNKDTEKS